MHVLMWMPGRPGPKTRRTASKWKRRLSPCVRQASKLGSVSDDLCPGPADIVHGFGLTALKIGEARRDGLPVAISPIYLPRSYARALALGDSRRR